CRSRDARPRHGALRHDLPRRTGAWCPLDRGRLLRLRAARTGRRRSGDLRRVLALGAARPAGRRAHPRDPRRQRRVSSTSRLFSLGLGYSALALARGLAARGWRIAGTVRTAERQAALAAEGIEAFLFDGDHPLADPAAALAGTTHLLASAPPDAGGDP